MTSKVMPLKAASPRRASGVHVGESQDVLEPLAIIGFSFKYPQDANSPEGFWKVMKEKRNVMTEWPKDRLNLDGFVSRVNTTKQQNFVPGAHFLAEDLGAFDAPFFGVSAMEAMAMDIQHRQLLETAYHALENAGIPMEKVSGSNTGVYSGSMSDDYQQIINKDADDIHKYAATGVARNMIANRLSWFYNLLGPSVNMDSACSSSLMAFEYACQALRNGDCNMALVAGSSISLAPESTLSLMKMSFLSPHGRCFSFDARANGYSRGEGFTVIVVKRLGDAIRDGETVRAVVRSCGSNQDGHTPGVTQPSKDMQAAIIKETYRKAGLSLDETRFLEAHGTGTALGDPIEAEAIGSVFRKIRSQNDPLYIGALKSNIGHLEGGSGVAGIVKAIMVLEKGVIPPNANFENINPRIDADFLNIKFPTQCTPWPSPGLRRASVASFGFGGSNSHVILDDAYNYMKRRGLSGMHQTTQHPPCLDHVPGSAPGIKTLPTGSNDITSVSSGCARSEQCLTVLKGNPSHERHGSVADTPTEHVQKFPREMESSHRDPGVEYHARTLLVLSAADEQGVARLAEAYEAHFRNSQTTREDEDWLCRLAYTLSTRRSSLPWKSFALVESAHSLASLKQSLSMPVQVDQRGGVAFIFTGQGAQYRNMGAQLLAHPVFSGTIKNFDRHLAMLGCTWSTAHLLSHPQNFHDIDDPEYSQPMTTALQLASFELLEGLDIRATVAIGHSSGEIAAAYAAGALNLASACKISYYRGKCASDLKKSARTPGAMMSVDLSEVEMQNVLAAHPHLEGNLYIACINSPCNVTISGDEAAIESVLIELNSRKVRTRRLNTGLAYHCPLMNQVAAQYAAYIAHLEPSRPEIGGDTKRPRMISSVTGKYVSDLNDVCHPKYWTTNLLSPVNFLRAILAVPLTSDKARTRKLGEDREDAIQDLVEIGPHSALRRPVLDCLEHRKVLRATERYHTVLVRQLPAIQTVLRLAGELHVRGHPVNVHMANQVNPSSQPRPELMVDLPSYTFDHSKVYWHEPPISRHSRLRKAPRLELLGVPVPDWNPLEPRWRVFLDASEMPWVEHHKVDGRIIYPATGMCVMAVEGAKQIADHSRGISGYDIRDAIFTAPISIGTADRCEVQLHMRSDLSQLDKNSASFEFRVYSLGHGEWFENCHGYIQVLYEGFQKGLDNSARQKESEFYSQKFRDAVQTCNQTVATERMYKLFKHNGLDYGPSFQALDKLRWGGKTTAIGNIKCFKWTSEQSSNLFQQHVAHPTTLDAAGQLAWVSLTKGAQEVLANGVAVTRIRHAWMAGSGLSFPETDHLQAYCTASIKGLRSTHSSVFALNPAGNLVLSISGMEMTSLGEAQGAIKDSIPRNICFRMSYKPDLALMDRRQLLTVLDTGLKHTVNPVAFYLDLELVLFYFASNAVDVKDSSAVLTSNSKPHMAKYVAWIKRQLRRYETGELGHSRLDWTVRAQDKGFMEQLIEAVEQYNSEGRLFVQIGRNLQSIIQGRRDPLEVMFESGLAERHYEEINDQMLCPRQLVNYLQLISHKNPHLKVLEVGAGTGSMTTYVLQGLRQGFGQYDYTDISEAFFEKARDKFSSTGHRINFSRLDIEQDPSDQGYKVGSYDLVIAGLVLHATHDIAATVQNVRRLLKPHGKVLLLENTRPEILRSGFAFGTLPGWWLSNDVDREWSPCMTEAQWTRVLECNGFRGVDIILPDYECDVCHENSIFIATAADSTEPERLQTAGNGMSTSLIVRADSAFQKTVAEALQSRLSEQQVSNSQVVCLEDQNLSKLCRGTTLVFLAELERPYLSTLTKSSFESLQALLVRAQKVVWVSSSSSIAECSAELQMVRGMSRALCTEKAHLVFVTLSFEDSQLQLDELVRDIFQVFLATVTKPSGECELEYIKRDGALMISRVIEASQLNDDIHSKTHTVSRHQEMGLGDPLSLAMSRSGLLDSIQWEEDRRAFEDLEPDQIEIQVQALGVNFRDLLILVGKYNDNTVGSECAGIVTRVGVNCTTFQKGDRVCALTMDCFRTYTRCHYLLAAKIPECLSIAEAASLPTTAVTAYYSLHILANLQEDETILIHSASGGTGQMALQIALTIGAEAYVTVGSEDKRQLLKEIYRVPDTHIFSSRDTSFSQEILHATNGKGVDVVLNSLAGKALLASWECIAPFGRFIELGKRDIMANSKLPMSQFAKEVTFHAVDMDFVSFQRPIIIQKALQAILDSVTKSRLKVASPLCLYTASEIETAFKIMRSGKNTGKAVLTLNSSDIVSKWIRPRFSCSLDPDATYLIAGGLGGLGRSAARWMTQQGARHLILLSRSGPKSHAAQALLKDLQETGVTIRAPKCDVSCYESLSTTLRVCSDLPPIKGCLQATMVLQDSLFEAMTWEKWSTSIHSKVASTQNLHRLLPQGLSFFIMLSSAAGVIGSLGQSNYAAGNTYQDGLAYHRVAIGEKAVSIDLGLMSDVGIVAENVELPKGKEAVAELAQIREVEFLALLDRYCNPELDILASEETQPILGLITPAQFRSKNIEPPEWLLERPIFRGLSKEDAGVSLSSDVNATTEGWDRDWAGEFFRAQSNTEAISIVTKALIQRLAKATSTLPDDIDPTRPLHTYGVDSLLAVEVRNWFGKVFKADVAIFDITGPATLDSLAERAAGQSSLRKLDALHAIA